MISFQPTDDQKMMQGSVADFAKKTLRPRIREFEEARALPDDVKRAAHEMGLGMVALPEAVGGGGLGMTTAVLLEEEIAWADPSAAYGMGGPGAFGTAVTELGTKEQAAALLAPFAAAEGTSQALPGPGPHQEPWNRFGAVAWGEPRTSADRAGLTVMAKETKDGWVLDGDKAYVINADRADRFVVFAEVDPMAGWSGVGAFVVMKDHPALDILPRETTLGLDVASFGGLRLKQLRVPKEARLLGGVVPGAQANAAIGEGFDRALIRFFAKEALKVAARAVGLSRAAFEVTLEYCDTRVAFGKPIGHFQAIAFTLADRAMDVEAARALVWKAAWLWDSGAREEESLLATAYAVSYALEAAMRAGDDAVQLHGGAGFMRDYPVEKMMRDAKQLQLCVMTSAHADQLAAVVELGRPLDPGAVLPSSDSQNAFV